MKLIAESIRITLLLAAALISFVAVVDFIGSTVGIAGVLIAGYALLAACIFLSFFLTRATSPKTASPNQETPEKQSAKWMWPFLLLGISFLLILVDYMATW